MIYDVAIIGGGVIGCAIANKLTRLNEKVIIIEKNSDVASETSKANSGIIHAGFDAIPNTKKAILNVRGAQLMPKLCKELDVDLKVNGALVIGNDLSKVEELYNRGLENGVQDLEILNRKQLEELLPNITENITCGLFAKNSAIISPYKFTIALAEEAVLNGTDIIFNYSTSSCKKYDDKYILSNGKIEIETKKIILACGGEHNEIAQILNSTQYDIKYRRGEYFLLDRNAMDLKYTIFPLPSLESKGILVSPTIHNNIIVGPTSIIAENNDTIISQIGLDEIKACANNMLDNVNLKKTIRVFSGVRTLVGKDFVIEKDAKNPDIINVTGICSPGLTASPAIAEEVAKLLNLDLSKEKKMIRRKEFPKIADMNHEKLNELIKSNPDFGKIVCRCEMVSLAEIKNAINSPLKPISLDGIKRRTRAGMGRCQGGFCFMKIMEIIAKERNISIDEVIKENKNSRIIVGNIK